ncbi:MAG: MFS transporter [Thermoplasmata archaeon]|nr:MAG: MFS transporter [Thermoplasmata archaeon]
MKNMIRLIPIQFLSNSALFASALFIPILGGELSATDFQVGLIVAAYAFALFLSSYIFGRASDVHGKKFFLQIGLFLSGIACLTQILASNVWTLAFSRLCVGFCAGIYPSAMLSKAYELKEGAIGKFASFGSFGWGFGILVAGVLSIYWRIFFFSSLMFFICFLLSFMVSFKREVKVAVPLFPKEVIKKSLPAYLTMLVRHSGACSVWVIFPLFLHEDLGGSKFWIAILYALNPLGQFLTMQSIDRVRSTRLIAMGLFISTISFTGLSFVNNFWQVVIPWILISVAWGFLYVGSLKFVMERNIEKATSVGILGSTLSISSIIGALIGGMVAWHFGRVANIILAAIMCGSALILFLLMIYTIDREQPIYR